MWTMEEFFQRRWWTCGLQRTDTSKRLIQLWCTGKITIADLATAYPKTELGSACTFFPSSIGCIKKAGLSKISLSSSQRIFSKGECKKWLDWSKRRSGSGICRIVNYDVKIRDLKTSLFVQKLLLLMPYHFPTKTVQNKGLFNKEP